MLSVVQRLESEDADELHIILHLFSQGMSVDQSLESEDDDDLHIVLHWISQGMLTRVGRVKMMMNYT